MLLFKYFTKMFFIAAGVWLSTFTNVVQAQEENPLPIIDWHKRITEDDRLTSFGPNLLGDSIDTHIGSIVFNHTDVSIPGNSHLEVAIRRSLKQGYKYKEGVDVGFGDWEIEVPRITAIVTERHGWAGDRCNDSWDENFPEYTWAANASSGNPSAGQFYRKDYSDGVSVIIPGQGSQSILKGDNNPTGFGVAYTANEWYFTCTTASDGKKGFIGHAPNGDKYYFDKFISRPYKRMGFAKATPTAVRRQKITFAATEVRDEMIIGCVIIMWQTV